MWPTLLACALLCASTVVIVRQRSTISGLQLKLDSRLRRVSRSVSYYAEPPNEGGDPADVTQTFYFPLYTQLSAKSIDRLCRQRSEKHSSDRRTENETVHKTRNRTKIGRKHPKAPPKASCSNVESLGAKTLIGARLHRVGAAIRAGDKWLLTEYSTGYSVFEFRANLSESIASSDPFAIHSLDDPFQGTDHTVINNGRTFVYHIAASTSIEFANFDSKRKIRKSLNISTESLYHNSYSNVDIEFDETALWVIYRKPHEAHLTVSRFDAASMTEKARWSLTHISLEKNVSNCFVACGILHTVTTVTSHGRSTNRIAPIFDFESGSYTDTSREKGLEWKGYGVPSNVQYDQVSRSLNVFDGGHIYSIGVNTA